MREQEQAISALLGSAAHPALPYTALIRTGLITDRTMRRWYFKIILMVLKRSCFKTFERFTVELGVYEKVFLKTYL